MAQVGILRVHEIDNNICPKTGKIFIRESEREGEGEKGREGEGERNHCVGGLQENRIYKRDKEKEKSRVIK